MARWAPEKKHTLSALADEILHLYAHGRAIVGIDGRRGSGAGDFADALAETMRTAGHRVFRASLRDFQLPRARRIADAYAHGFDYSLLRRVLIDPYRTAGSTGFVLEGFDEDRDEPVFQPKWMSAGPDAVLIIDGVYLHRPELAGVWNYSVWLETPDETGDADDARYIAAERPSARATAIYDGADPGHPRRIFADSC